MASFGLYSIADDAWRKESSIESKQSDVSEREVYTVLPHDGDINEIYHGHSGFSDGKDTFHLMVEEAFLLGLDSFGVMDHLDLTGISNQTHQGPWLGYFSENKEYRDEMIQDYVDDFESGLPQDKAINLSIGQGAEIDWDPNNIDELISGIEDLDFDYTGISVHYDRNGNGIKNPQIIEDRDIGQVIEEYVEDSINAVEALDSVGVDVLCHPGRAEEGVLEQEIDAQTYFPIIDTLKTSDMAYEFNPKVHLRYLLNNGKLPAQINSPEEYIQELPSEFEALATYPEELPNITVGTDTHRVGHSDSLKREYRAMTDLNFDGIKHSKVTESQMRLKFAEDVFKQLSEIRNEEIVTKSILEDKDLPEISRKPPTNNQISKKI